MPTSMNFEHLRANHQKLAELGAYAETYAVTDPQSSMVKLRCFVELIVGHIYNELRLPVTPGASIYDKLTSGAFTAVVDKVILEKFDAIRRGGNKAAHEGYTNQHDAQWLVKEAYFIGCWFYMAHLGGKRENCPIFTPVENAPRDNESKAEFKRKNKALQQKISAHDVQLQKALDELKASQEAQELTEQENAKLKLVVDQVKSDKLKSNTLQLKATFDFNEAETRDRIIDAELRSYGWDVSLDEENTDDVAKEYKVTGQPTATGVGYCDYVLWDDNGKSLAVIEAKRTRVSAQAGREQAKLYADALEQEFNQRPVIFYTNGFDIWMWDDAQKYPPRKLYGYYSKDSLRYQITQRTLRKNLNETPIDIEVAGRLYQMETITRVSERFSDKHRKALIVQATGTGKTRVSIALTKRLLDANWAKRVLFLCDRKELRKQASNAFNEFTSEPLHVVGKSKKANASNARVYIATYPGMMGLYEQFDVGYFDLIIADESHRSIYNKFGDIFKYFDALQVGLTATPVEMVSRSTCELFGCDYKLPTANYPLETAIEENNLVPFKVVSHTTKFLRDGIQGSSLSDEQIAQLEEQGIDPNTLEFDAKSVDKAIFNKDTNRAIIKNLMEKGIRDIDGQLPGKTIVFARSIKHAELIAELFDEMYPDLGGNFCRVIHSKFERADELIDNFKSSEKPEQEITIAVSVDMLDTGIDVPECVNLVFAKPIKSKVKFWQMVGRGTRLCEGLYGQDKNGKPINKSHFLIFDHWENFAYFEEEPEEVDPVQAKSLSQKLFEARLKLAEKALQKAEMHTFTMAIPLIKADIASLNDKTIAIRDKWKVKAQLNDEKTLSQFSPDTKTLLFNVMAPLMQWKNIKGESDALRLDLQIAELQLLTITQPTQIDVAKIELLNKVSQLSMHLNEVRAKNAAINEIQQDSYWQNVTVSSLEQSRLQLRGIIHLRDKQTAPPEAPTPIIDVKEDAAEYIISERKTKIVTIDYKIFSQQVEKSLAPLFETNSVLQKIRQGKAVTEEEVEQLNALVHTQNPAIDLKTLQEFYPESSASLDQILRTLVGMDAPAIEQTFMEFVQQIHTHVTAKQQRFIGMLKNHLIRYGAIEISQLYEAPFTSIHDEGLDGVFNPEQADVIATFVEQFNVPLGGKASSVNKQITL
jgi:type I restriction enzyme R subunit